MNTTLLIHAIVRQTMVLIAALATVSGRRTPLGTVADEVFSTLVRELEEQGVGHKVIADMLGMALRTYHSRTAKLAESTTEQGRSLWEAVLTHVRKGKATRGEVPLVPQRVVVILSRVTDGDAVTGTLTFGDGPPPPPPKNKNDVRPPGTETLLPDNLMMAPYVGFEYTILPSDVRGNFLTIAFVPAELYRAYCALQTPFMDEYDHTWVTFALPGGAKVCDCTETECHPVSTPIRRMEMIVGPDSMVGQLQFAGGIEPPSVRLKRVE